MAQYDVIFKCGCQKTIELFGKSKDRERKIEYLQNQFCRDCQALGDNRDKITITVSYSDYKNNPELNKLDVMPDSYNKKDKTIVLFADNHEIEISEDNYNAIVVEVSGGILKQAERYTTTVGQLEIAKKELSEWTATLNYQILPNETGKYPFLSKLVKELIPPVYLRNIPGLKEWTQLENTAINCINKHKGAKQ